LTRKTRYVCYGEASTLQAYYTGTAYVARITVTTAAAYTLDSTPKCFAIAYLINRLSSQAEALRHTDPVQEQQ
jgi:hypothetical protein